MVTLTCLIIHTGFTPFELMFGREIRGPTQVVLKEAWTLEKKLPTSVLDYILKTQERLQQMSDLMRENDKKSKKTSKHWYDKKSREDPIAVGEDVLVLMPDDNSGLTAQWHGPFSVLEKPTPLTYIISTPSRGRRTRTFHRNMLKRFIPQKDVYSGRRGPL